MVSTYSELMEKEKSKPFITVITAVFNGELFLEETILSVLCQHYSNIDIIIIDGGSKDGTLSVIDKYKDKLFYWISEPDLGIYDAFNKGWNAAREDSYILYLGAGDKILSLPKVEIVRDAQIIYGRVLLGNEITVESKVDFRLKLGNTLHHQALLVKKTLNPHSPFDLRFKTYADFDFNQRLFKKEVSFTKDPAFVSYAMPGGVSQKFNVEESISVVQKNYGKSYSIIARLYYLFQDFKRRF